MGERGKASANPDGSVLEFVRADTGTGDGRTMRQATVLASSAGLGWDGVVAEMGTSTEFIAERVELPHHHVAINLDAKPLVAERSGPDGDVVVEMPPRGLWIATAGTQVTHRNGLSRWGAVQLSRESVRRALGGRDLPAASLYVVDDVLANAVMTLLEDVMTRGSSGPLLADGMAIAIAARLAHHTRVTGFGAPKTGGLGQDRLRRVIEVIENQLAERLTTTDLAAVAELSPAHFARAFKQDTNESPHAFIVSRRLLKAREMLVAGAPASDAAAICGFADQPHFTRLFRRRFGITPAAFAKRHRA